MLIHFKGVLRHFKKEMFYLLVMLFCVACGNNGNQGKLTNYGYAIEEDDNTVVNAIEQAKPTIMVLPSDNLLQSFGALKSITQNGTDYLDRDYSQYLLSNPDNRAIISVIQNEFVQLDYPLTDLEQTLKSLNNRAAIDMADDFAQDAKTLLLQTASPDIIIELDYDCKYDPTDPNFRKNMSYTVTAFDAYTNKAFSSKTMAESVSGDIAKTFSQTFHKNMKEIEPEIGKYFQNIVVFGREITVRFTVAKKSKINLSSESITGDTYADWIVDYMDLNTKKGAYKLQNNTDYELYFVNVRIPALQDDGTQYSAYKWARELIQSFKTECGVKCTNKVQGLGDVTIMINGL